MSDKKQHFLNGFCSLSVAFAPVDFSRHIKYSSAKERFDSHWYRTGDSMRRSVNHYEQQSEKAKKTDKQVAVQQSSLTHLCVF